MIKKIAMYSVIAFLAFTFLSVAVANHENAKTIREYNAQKEQMQEEHDEPRVLETIVRNS